MKTLLKNSQVTAFRLMRHHLLAQKPANLLTICREVCGMQAQVMSAAEMAWWARNHALTRAHLHAALWHKRTLIKTYAMRGTLHVLTAEDFPIYIGALKRSQSASVTKIMIRLGLTTKEIERLREVSLAALRAGSLTQGQLTDQVQAQVGKKVREAMSKFWNVFRMFFSEGLICYGPPQGQEVNFMRVDQWLPAYKEISEEEARQNLLRRYLRAYGPATPQDFSRWTGMAMPEVKAVFAALAEALFEVETEAAKVFILREDFEPLCASKMPEPTLRLLPSFDPFMLGHVDKSLLVDSKNYKRVYRNQGWLSHVILRNGRALGAWNYKRRGKLWSLEIAPFEKISQAVRAQIIGEAESLGEFLGCSWEALRFAA